MIRFEPVEPSGYGPRAGIIHSDTRDIETPARVLNSSETRYKTKGITWRPYRNRIVEYVRNFDAAGLHEMRHQNGVMANEVKAIRAVLRKNPGRLSLFFPRIRTGTELVDDDIRTLLDLQGLAQINLVAVPDSPALSPDDFAQRVQSAREYLERTYPQAESFPLLDMRAETDAFSHKVSWALDSGFKLVGLRYAALTQYYPNYRTITRMNDEEVWLHLHGVPRFWRSNYTTSQIHIPSFAGVDTVALDAPWGGPRPPGRPEDVKRFDAHSLGHLNKKTHREMYGQDLGCDCPLCTSKSLDDFYREYLIGPKSRLPRVPRLRQCAAVHEVFSSTAEFPVWREHLTAGEIRDYVQSKRYLRDALSTLGMLP